MTNLNFRWLALLPVLALALAGNIALAAKATGQFERTLTVTGPVDLEVSTGSGHITVRPGESNRVRVKGTIEAHSDTWWGGGLDPQEKVRRIEANPPIQQSGNTIRIGKIEDRELRQNVSISYEIEVPTETRLTAHSGSGHQKIEGIRGPVTSSSGSGHLEISNIGDAVQADTGSGHIELDRIRGAVKAQTGSGSIVGTGVGGVFSGRTGSGRVSVELSVPGPVDISTGSGSVEVRGARGSVQVSTGSGSVEVHGEATQDWKLSTGSGSITARLPANAAFELYARSHSGSVHTSHPVTVLGAVKRNEVRGTVRGGGPRVNLETGSGTIRIE